MGLTIKELIPIGERLLSEGGVEDYKIDAEALLSHAIGYDKNKIFMNWAAEIDFKHTEVYFDLLNLRAKGTPLQYITGEQYFMGRRFSVNESVLIPRPETEGLVESITEYMKQVGNVKTLLDIGTGSGAIAISLAKVFPSVKVTAVDISEEALKVARQNAKALGAEKNITFIKSDLFSAIKTGALGKKFDIIVSNPPYISSGEIAGLQREVKEHEPLLALDAGEDGLIFFRRIAEEAKPYFKKKAALFFEIGAEQGEAVSSILEEAGSYSGIEVRKDLAGLDRIVNADYILGLGKTEKRFRD
ncbi:MAG: peptide chain release factor N(5)-glutamine methyltransferase [Clostridiales Family XIII bacterium]|jgi:release factor glutamine methyltransferase|nr:peptide chain release factor N(5)-glutamine methyltransferase [Clostridiales Family XIII bacterium]